VGPAFAAFLAILSIVVSVCSDIWAGLPYSERPILFENAVIAFAVFAVAICLLHALKRFQLRRK
jgi:xanthine/uracil/vitamin C permease (AzgA family)